MQWDLRAEKVIHGLKLGIWHSLLVSFFYHIVLLFENFVGNKSMVRAFTVKKV